MDIKLSEISPKISNYDLIEKYVGRTELKGEPINEMKS